ncbi:glycosyltransferase [Paenibacillus sp. OV219]|uniref:CgeB family protein n=1 Tax=Paenibacillus sp. OV219 TaxID=1884377 RepID=UPI000B859645|nr:glycosyltransferase [Paenibacillus sp. OV219]
MFIPQGFEAIDAGVTEALRRNVRELHVVDAKEMLQKAQEIRPSLVLVLNGLHVFPAEHLEHIALIRSMGILTAVWFADDPYVTDLTVEHATRYDFVFTHERTCEQLYRNNGSPQAFHLPLAAHFDLYQPMHVPPQYQVDICFVGVAFWNRVHLFDELAPYLKNKKVLIAGSGWIRLKNHEMLKPFIHDGWLDVAESIKYYNGAKIVINLHRTAESRVDNANGYSWPAESINPRTFEIAAAGAFQLTDLRSELPQFYHVGTEIVAYENAAQLIEQLEYYLRNDKERLQIAARGYRRTLRQHTFSSRIQSMLDIIGLK